MDCPVCGERLKEIERSGVMVDICPSCKGVWLDRGEIDKLIEAEAKGDGAPRPEADRRDQENETTGHAIDDHGGTRSTTMARTRHRSEAAADLASQDLLGGLGGD